MTICLSHGGISTYVSTEEETEILIGTVGGVYVLQRHGARQWRVGEKWLDGCHIHALMIEPRSKMIFAGVRKGSIYASRDHGKAWSLTDMGLTEQDIYSLGFASFEDGAVRLYAGTEPAHLYKSDDLGGAWEELTALRDVPSVAEWTFPSPPHEAHVKYITFEPDNPRTIYVCIEQGGLFKSDDSGATWRELHGFETNLPFELPKGLSASDVHRLVVRRSEPAWLCLSGGVGICRSVDGGQTWEHLTTPHMRIGYPDALLIHPKDESLLFMAGARHDPAVWRTTHDADSAIARSKDGGLTWQILGNGLPEHIRGNIAAMSLNTWDQNSSIYVATTDGDVFFSDDEGDNWLIAAQRLPPVSKARHYLTLQTPAEETQAPRAR